jgi:hypothetical protein
VDEIFSKRPYLVVRIPAQDDSVGAHLNRNGRQNSRNPFMRNLLTLVGHSRNRKKRAKLFVHRFQTFFNSSRANFFPIASPRALAAQKNCGVLAPVEVHMYVTARPETPKVFRRIAISSYFWQKFYVFVLRSKSKRIAAVLLLPFPVN